MENSDILVVVLSRNYSTGLSVIRSLGTRGYTVDLVASAPKEGASHFIAKSKFIRNAVEVVAKKVKDEDDYALLEALRSYGDGGRCASSDAAANEADGSAAAVEGTVSGEADTSASGLKPILIAADDYTASVMDRHRDELSEIFVLPGIVGGEPGSLTRMMDKSVQGEIARSVGIKTPEEWVVSLREDEIGIPDDMIYPCFVKPLGSTVGYKQEMARCDDREELCAHLMKLKEFYANRSVLVQEFMNIDEEYDLEGVMMDREVILPGIIWKKVVASYDRGVPLHGFLYPTDKFGSFMEKVYAFLREFHYFGMFDLGFNKIGDEYYFNELNLRSGGTNYVYFESGSNLSEAFVRAALNEVPDPDIYTVKEFGKSYIYEKVAWDDLFHKYLTKKELDQYTESSDIHIMMNEYDPEPGDIFYKEVRAAYRLNRKREERDKCVRKAMEDTGWEYDFAREQVRDIRHRLGIDYKEIASFKLWGYPPEEQAEAYEKAYKRRERIKKNREACLDYTTDIMGWDRDYALEQINDARARLGISYKEYQKYKFCLIPVEEQAEEYEKIKLAKEKAAELEKSKIAGE